MAVRLRNTQAINFGTVGGTADVTINFISMEINSESSSVLGLNEPYPTFSQGESMEFEALSFELLFPSGDYSDDFMQEILEQAITAASLTVKAHSGIPEVSDSGYSAQTLAVGDITFTQQAD